MDPSDRAALNQIFVNFKKSYKKALIDLGINRVKNNKSTINTLTNDITFPEFLLDVEKATAKEIVAGRVQIVIPLLSDPQAANDIFNRNGYFVSSCPAALEFTSVDKNSKQAASNAKEYIDALTAFSTSLTNEVAEFKAEYPRIIQAALDAEQQRIKDIQSNNDELTNILLGK